MPYSGGLFPGGLTGDANALLVFAIAAAFLYLTMLHRPPSPRRTLAKTAAVGLLAALAHRAGAPDLMVAALMFSAAGDAALSVEGEPAFLAGLGAFLLAHLAYAALFLAGGDGFSPAEQAVAAGIVLFGLGFGAVLVRKAGRLALPVAVYVAAIMAMGVTAAGAGGLILAGALAFIASDALLGSERFLLAPAHPARRMTAPAVWVLYVAGQMLMLLGVLLPA